MYSVVSTAAAFGLGCRFIGVEADVSDGLPVFEMVGYLSSEVKEAKERVRTAMKNSGYLLPPKRITVNLSPIHVRKEGNCYDLPVAVAIMSALGILKAEDVNGWLIVGEVGLDGSVHPSCGILPIVAAAKEAGFTGVMLPKKNAAEGAMVRQISVVGVSSLNEAVHFFKADAEERRCLLQPPTLEPVTNQEMMPDFSDINGQHQVKRACEVAVAGMHHFLMIGPPGSGKTMIASRIPSILPEMTPEERMEISKIYSIAGLLDAQSGLVKCRPFRAPHHSISTAALIGGGSVPRPGEVSLAHGGVLFLDEMTEFQRGALEAMRQPLEDRKVLISRVNGTMEYPANCMLVCATNPCPCGFYPDRKKCTCSTMAVRRYLGKISGPLLDRVDISIMTQRMTYSDIIRREKEETSEEIRRRVEQAHQIQKERYAGTPIRFNANLSAADIYKYCSLSGALKTYMESVFENLGLSARGYYKILKVARTIADLEGNAQITQLDLAEAVSYRVPGVFEFAEVV